MEMMWFVSVVAVFHLIANISVIWASAAQHDNQYAHVDDQMESRHRKASPRIIGGQDAPYGRFPFFATLEDGSSFRCGGSLIAPNVVLSAAHCTGSYLNFVSIGRYDLADMYEPNERFQVKQVVIHPQYQVLGTEGTYATFDFALIQFDGVSSTTPVLLNNNDNIPSDDMELTVMGFGATNLNYEFPSVLQQTTLKFVRNTICKDAGDGTYSYAEKILPDMMCAAAPARDACLGDSGGPMIIRGKSLGHDVQVGLVSWGFECALPAYPGVYSRISHVYDWIDSTVCDMTNGVTHNGKVSGCLTIPTQSPTDAPSAPPMSAPTTLSPLTSLTNQTASPSTSPFFQASTKPATMEPTLPPNVFGSVPDPTTTSVACRPRFVGSAPLLFWVMVQFV